MATIRDALLGGVLLAAACGGGDDGGTNPPPGGGNREWTVMVYMAADNSLAAQGVFDMVGNAGEWVADLPGGLRRTYRGGSFKLRPDSVASAVGGSPLPSTGLSWVGFRIVVDVK